ncbi:hypothetical protein BDW67DRAFT_175235 [Aspergillus spinulosporus]
MESPANSTTSDKSRDGPRKYAYLPFWGFSNSEKCAQESMGNYPNASRDNVLTVFAQLAALRMNGQRAMISLFDRKQQYVIAEATPRSCLRGESGRDQADGFWLGVGQFPRQRIAMCYHAMKSFIEEERDLFIVNDLTKDERFRDHSCVTGHPHNRFYVSVPIQSPDDYIIGAVAVLDNKPRDGISGEQERFLSELAATVMDHLLSQRAMREEYREEKMVRALGLFVKGKSNLNEWFDSGENPSSRHRDQMGQINRRLERIQRDVKHKHESPVQKFVNDDDRRRDSGIASEDAETHKKRPKLSPTTSHLQDTLAPVYSRRKAVGSNQGKRRDAYNVERQERNGSNEEDIPSATKDDSQSNLTASEDDEEARSLVLGHYTSSTLDHLIDQYPRGKIFHIEEDGSISLSYEGLADEMHYSGKGSRGALTNDSDMIDVKQETSDIQQLMKVLPDARCVAIYPIWDFQRGRYFTVNVVWTNDPGRVLSEPKDLTYLAAFSNTVMAEVSRLDLEAADRAKGDFISSISHELRSPLHGLLWTVELLQEMVNGYAQHSLIETVYSCGRTLLDTLNHLLDYAKINTLSQPTPLEKPRQKALSEARPTVPGSLQDEDLGVLVQEVVEGILAGVEYQRRGADGGSGGRRGPYGNANSRLITIVDIEWNDSWRYSVYAGAWRRVVMNLFGNALKYTQTGYIRLLMRNDILKRDGQNADPAIRMTFSDSGRGMSKDFIANHLYTAFHQEDTTSPGLGVGLHLVHQIVKSLNGTIDFTSELGKGTDVDVVLPINPPEDPRPEAPLYGSLKEKLQGKTISLFTQTSKLGDIGMDPKVFNNMLISLGRMTRGWFGLRVLTPDEHDRGEADFAIVTEHEYKTYYRKGSSMPKEQGSSEIQPTYPLIVLSERASSWRVIEESVEEENAADKPRVSPKTLATAFEHCLAASGTALHRTEDSDPMSMSEKCEHSSSVMDGDSPNKTLVTEMAVDGGTDNEKGPATDGDIDGATAGTVNGAVNGAPCTNDNPARHRILLVEDNKVNLKVIELDVVIMDVSMPVMDGLTATREMRKFERRCRSNCQQSQDRKRATIIALTAVLSASTQHEATVSGVDLFLTKPAPLKQLKEILEDLREGKEIHQE